MRGAGGRGSVWESIVATEIVMPKMGYDMTEGKLLRWFKSDGDRRCER